MKAAISSEGSQEIQKEKGKSENKERIMRRISIIGLKKNWEGRKKKKEPKPSSQMHRTDWWVPEWGERVGQEMGKMGGGSQKVQTSGYKIN